MNDEFTKNTMIFIKKKGLILLIIFWLLVQAFLLITQGINTGGESINKIQEAENLISGKGLSSKSDYLYLTEIFLIFLKLKAHAGYGAVIAIQLILNLSALIYFYKFLNSFYSSKILSFTGCLILLACFPYQIYNTFLYTESIFFSLSLIYSCYLLQLKKLSLPNIFILFLFLFLLCITRPSGIFFMAATIVYLFFFISKTINPVVKAAVFITVSCFALFILNYLMASGGGIDILLPFKDERVICGIPTLSYNADIKTVQNGNSLYGLIYYVTHNFSQFSRLALLKSKAFFGLVRPYYSYGHNVFLVIYFYTLYALIILNIIKINKKLPVAFIYFIALTVIYWLSVVFSCDEWHNRFFITLTPFFIIPALYLFNKNNTRLPA